MEKSYKLWGTDRLGHTRMCTIRTSSRPNSNKWLEKVAEAEMWYGTEFTKYVAELSDNPYRPIKGRC